MSRRLRSRCRFCARSFGRRTNRAGVRGYCGSTCADAADVREALAQKRVTNMTLLERASMSINDLLKNQIISPQEAYVYAKIPVNAPPTQDKSLPRMR